MLFWLKMAITSRTLLKVSKPTPKKDKNDNKLRNSKI